MAEHIRRRVMCAGRGLHASPGSYQCRHPAGWVAHPYAGRFAEPSPYLHDNARGAAVLDVGATLVRRHHR